MLDVTKDMLAVVGLYALLFGGWYWIASHMPTRAHQSRQEPRHTQAVRVRLPNVDAPLYGLPDVKRRGEGDKVWNDDKGDGYGT